MPWHATATGTACAAMHATQPPATLAERVATTPVGACALRCVVQGVCLRKGCTTLTHLCPASSIEDL